MVVNCNYDCFNCPYPDCINDALPTSKEAEYMQIGHMKYTGAKKSKADKRYRNTLKGKLTHQKAQKEYYRKCSVKILEARRLYYQEHKEEEQTRRKKHYEQHKEEELKKAREYKEKNKKILAEKRKKNRTHENELARINYEKNKEKINARKRAWYEKNKERINEKNRLKRARERRAKECNVHVVIS